MCSDTEKAEYYVARIAVRERIQGSINVESSGLKFAILLLWGISEGC